ncbi:MAG TPA: acyl-CoA thioesterase, partial [Polyangiaceae bacterium]|nr:acyl-CoA thioesterase [Polyangiaceae bacterium]
RPPADATRIEAQVPFHDVDSLQIVWHGHYYKYFEIARTALFLRHGIDGRDMLQLGYRFVVSHGECRHLSPMHYLDRYRVSAWFRGDAEHKVEVLYECWNVTTDKRAARARTTLVTTDPHGTLLLVTPDVIQKRIQRPSPTSEAR